MKIKEMARIAKYPKFLRELYNNYKNDREICLEIVKNPATPVDVLSDIAVSCEDSKMNFFHSTESNIEIIAEKSSNRELLRKIYDIYNCNPEICKKLSLNPWTPADVIIEIVNKEFRN